MCHTKITVQNGAERDPKDAEAAGRRALDGDLASAQGWSAVEYGCSLVSALGRRDGGRLATGVSGRRWGGSPPCAEGAKAELPVRWRWVARGPLRPSRRAPVRHLARRSCATLREVTRRTARGALRAPLKPWRKVVTVTTTAQAMSHRCLKSCPGLAEKELHHRSLGFPRLRRRGLRALLNRTVDGLFFYYLRPR